MRSTGIMKEEYQCFRVWVFQYGKKEKSRKSQQERNGKIEALKKKKILEHTVVIS
jgi:hypothetical protein